MLLNFKSLMKKKKQTFGIEPLSMKSINSGTYSSDAVSQL